MMKPVFRFRLNGEIMMQLSVRHEIADGQMTGKLELVVRDEQLGWFSVNDDQDLPDSALPKFIFHFRNETEWLELSSELKRASKDKGWKRATAAEVITMLRSAGLIRTE